MTLSEDEFPVSEGSPIILTRECQSRSQSPRYPCPAERETRDSLAVVTSYMIPYNVPLCILTLLSLLIETLGLLEVLKVFKVLGLVFRRDGRV